NWSSRFRNAVLRSSEKLFSYGLQLIISRLSYKRVFINRPSGSTLSGYVDCNVGSKLWNVIICEMIYDIVPILIWIESTLVIKHDAEIELLIKVAGMGIWYL